MTSLYKKSDEDPTLLTGQSSIISENGNIEAAGSFVEGNRVILPESRITKASQKPQAFMPVNQMALKKKKVMEYKQRKSSNKRKSSPVKKTARTESNDSTPKASIVCSLPLSALGDSEEQNYKMQVEAIKQGDLYALNRVGNF